MSRSERSRGRQAVWATASVGVGCFLLGAACDWSTKPLGSGDDVTVDVEASAAPPPSNDDGGYAADSPFGRVDGPYGPYSADASALVSVCEQCACPTGTYCFGGATGYTAFSGVCDQTEAGANVGSGLSVGCQPLPGACANEPDCPCLLNALRPQLSCVAVCAEVSNFTVYCPTP